MAVAVLFLLYGLYAGALYLGQEHMLYPVQVVVAPETARLPDEQSELLRIPTAAGDVEAWLLKPLDGTGRYPVILHAHGNGDVIDGLPFLFRWPRERGFGVLLVEYPGYGRSAGRPGERAIHQVMLRAYDLLRSRGDVRDDSIIGYGWSLGGGPVCNLVGERPLAGLILRSTFTRLADFAWRYGVPPVLLRDRYDNLAAVRRYRGPVMIFHGEQDTTIPYRMGKALARAAQVPLHTWPCGHNGCPEREEIFWEAVEPFLHEIVHGEEVP